MLQANSPTGRPLRIVVADHVKADRDAICQLLRVEKNFLVEEAASDAALMALLAAGDIDCVTVDRMLGPESGFDVNDRIKAKYPDPPAVIMLIATGNELAAIKAFRCGFSDYVKKTSLNSRELINAISHAVDRRRAERLQKAELDSLAKLALRDRLTGLPNRQFLEERLMLLIAGAKRHRNRFAILKIDINALKKINDSFGLAVGDAALKAFADRLKEVARASDIFGRLGGDEFLYLIDSDVSPETTDLACGRLAEALSFSIELESVGLSLSANIGAALYSIDGNTAAELLGAADRAMHAAKASAGGYALASAPVSTVPIAAQWRPALALEAERTADSNAEPESAATNKDLPFEHEFSSPLPEPTRERRQFAEASAARGSTASGGGSVHRDENRRTDRRHRVLKRGLIVNNDGYSTMNCLIRDLSSGGARITVEDEYMGHENFSLLVVETGKRFSAETRWQKGREIGLQFVA